jgi:hypothetical protein
MKLTITNKEALDAWIKERLSMGRDMYSIKGPAPEGAAYDDGDLIVGPVNVAWQDTTTGEIFAIEYADCEEDSK